MTDRGRPLSQVSLAVLDYLRVERPIEQRTFRSVAISLQLSTEQARVTCRNLVSAGRLHVIGRVDGAGSRPASAYSTPASGRVGPSIIDFDAVWRR